jgi:ribonuclease J
MRKKAMKSNPALSVGSPVKEHITRILPKRFPRPRNDEVLVCTLGGVGEIGMNWTLYGHDGRWVLVDAGIAFAREFPSVNAVFLDPATLHDILPLIDAAIITHAHEDHIGAVHRIWPQIGCPIYVTPFAKHFLAGRLNEAGIRDETVLRLFNPGDRLEIGPFTIQTVHLTHSVPECVGLLFETKAGKVFHTGDWKFDDNPVVGLPTDKALLKAIGDEGVLAMVCDSTNADRPGRATSEGDLINSFKSILADYPSSSVTVTCFASNVARMLTVMKAGDTHGRYVAMSGRSMLVMSAIATDLGMMDGVLPLISREHLCHVDRNQRLLLCTGTQGESNATLARLARGDQFLPIPAIEPGDVFVFSSSVIPGNEHEVDVVKADLRRRGAVIIEGSYKGMPLAASGHAKADELAEMNALIRPRFLIPVHGTPDHLEANSEISRNSGIEKAFAPVPGDVLSISNRGVRPIARVETRLLCQYDTKPREPAVVGPWNEAVKQRLRDQAMELAAVG